MGFSKLPQVPEEAEKLSSNNLDSNESVEEYCNSKFYLPSIEQQIDCNSNLIDTRLDETKSKIELIKFLKTGDRIFCNECNFILTSSQANSDRIDNKHLNNVNNVESSLDLSLCSLHNASIYELESIDQTSVLCTENHHSKKSEKQM